MWKIVSKTFRFNKPRETYQISWKSLELFNLVSLWTNDYNIIYDRSRIKRHTRPYKFPLFPREIFEYSSRPLVIRHYYSSIYRCCMYTCSRNVKKTYTEGADQDEDDIDIGVRPWGRIYIYIYKHDNTSCKSPVITYTPYRISRVRGEKKRKEKPLFAVSEIDFRRLSSFPGWPIISHSYTGGPEQKGVREITISIIRFSEINKRRRSRCR